MNELIEIFKLYGVPEDLMKSLVPKIYASIPNTEKERLMIQYAPTYLQSQGYGRTTNSESVLEVMKQYVSDNSLAVKLSKSLTQLCGNASSECVRKYYELAYISTKGNIKKVYSKSKKLDTEIQDVVLRKAYENFALFPKNKDITDGLPNCRDVQLLHAAWQKYVT